MSSYKAFENLMSKYGGEAEAEKLAQAKALHRAATMRKIRKGFLYLCLLGAAYAAFHYRGDVVLQVNKVMAVAEAPVKHGEATKNKALDIKKDAERRNVIIDEMTK